MTDYTLFYVLCGFLASFSLIVIDIIISETNVFVGKRRMKLRDRLHFAMNQNRGDL